MKTQSFLRDNYLKSWNYIKEIRSFIYLSILIFFVFAVMGFFVPVPEILSERILDILRELISQTEGMSQGELISFILANNLQSGFFAMLFGVFLGVFPIISSAVNGFIVGFVGALSVKEVGFSVLFNLLPHGIFELPAIFISFGMGIKMGSFIFQKKKWKSLKEFFWNSVRVFLSIVLPLLVIAAIIEGALIFASIG
jgi:stage II sporulation protein M